MLLTGCTAEQPAVDTRGVLDLFISGPPNVSLDGLVYIMSGGDAGVLAGALAAEHPVMKMMLPPGQDYTVAVTGLGRSPGTTDNPSLACEGSQDFHIRELRTTEVDLDIDCEAVGLPKAPIVSAASCSVAAMLVAPRIQHVGGTILAFADPFPQEAVVRLTTPDNGVGRILSAGQDTTIEYAFECIQPGFSEIVAEVTAGACRAQAASAVVCVVRDATIEPSD